MISTDGTASGEKANLLQLCLYKMQYVSLPHGAVVHHCW
jgi:hypothetical protein